MSCVTKLCNDCNKIIKPDDGVAALKQIISSGRFGNCFSTDGSQEDLLKKHCFLADLANKSDSPIYQDFHNLVQKIRTDIGKALRDSGYTKPTNECTGGNGKNNIKKKSSSRRGNRSKKSSSRRKRKTSKKSWFY
jgi:hypothetical protein